MIFIPLDNLKPGMVVAKNIYMDFCLLPLLTKDQVLNDIIIHKLRLKEISGLYVKSNYGDDIVVKSIIDDKLKQDTIVGMKKIFHSIERSIEFTEDDYKSVSGMAKNLVMNILLNDDLMINMIELKSHSNYTYYHSLSVSIISVVIGAKLGLDTNTLNDLAMCGLLHDIGKTLISLDILDKPSFLTPEEFDIIKDHPNNAKRLLETNRTISLEMLHAIKGHHEKYDGSGYPDGLEGQAIPLFSRIVAIADVYDALTSQRSYRKPCFPKDAIEYMMGCSETHFETELLETFLHTVAVYPAGTLVLLSNNERAVVVKNYDENTLRPLVRVINDEGECVKDLDLLHDPQCMNIVICGMGYDDNTGNFATVENILVKKEERVVKNSSLQ